MNGGMPVSTPKIRHLAIIARDPAAVAAYYQKVFEMKLIHKSDLGAHFVSDGYLTLAIIQHRLTGSAPVGLNHFGFSVEDRKIVMERIKEYGLEEAKQRPDDRPFAEFRACDPEGNFFDISAHGFDDVQDAKTRAAKEKQPA
jgi:catechol 2,3-dioxygenase-like lactoylglutathione lyase family enzyme